jgi:hypothetical protein
VAISFIGKVFIPSRIINHILAGGHFKILTIFIVSRIINDFLAGENFKILTFLSSRIINDFLAGEKMVDNSREDKKN